jgi:hypothetical protein
MGVPPIVGLRVQRPFARRQERSRITGQPGALPIVHQQPMEATIRRQPMDTIRQHTVSARLP